VVSDSHAEAPHHERLAWEAAQTNHLSQMGLGVTPRTATTAPSRPTSKDSADEASDTALAGLHKVVQYVRYADRAADAPHIAREAWDRQTDPLPAIGQIDPTQEIGSVARTQNGDVSFLNQDGLPVASRFRLEATDERLREGLSGPWMQREMQKVTQTSTTGLEAGHHGPVSEGGVHAVEFTTPQTRSFNSAKQGGWEGAIRSALAANPGAQIEVEMVIDRPRGQMQPDGYWFSSELIRTDGSRINIDEATGYWSQTG